MSLRIRYNKTDRFVIAERRIKEIFVDEVFVEGIHIHRHLPHTRTY